MSPELPSGPSEFDSPEAPVGSFTLGTLTIPEEGTYTEAERQFISNEPDILPSNQDSVYGQLRKTITDVLQQFLAYRQSLWNNMWPQFADVYLPEWEFLVDLPINPTGKSIELRRASVLARFLRGAFTRAKRDSIISDFIRVSVEGEPARFVPEGIDFTGGIPFFPEHADLSTRFTVYEFVEYFYYHVMIGSGYIGDIAGLTRELKRITPAGMTFAIDDSRAIPINLYWLFRHLDPQGFWPLDETSGTVAHDFMINASNDSEYSPGVYNGGPTLNNRMLAPANAGSKAPLFDGTNDNVIVANTSRLITNDKFTLVALIYPVEAKDQTIISMGTSAPQMQITTNGRLRGIRQDTLVTRETAPGKIPLNAISLIGYSKSGDGGPGKLWINGSEDTSGDFDDVTMLDAVVDMTIGSRSTLTEWFHGNIGFVAVLDREMSPPEWDRLYKTTQNLMS